MKRRSFLRHMTHGMAVPGALGAMGFKMPGASSFQSLMRLANTNGRVLVMIYLEGGNDGLNTVIPQGQLSNLHHVRPHVILPDDSLIPLRQTDAALHPAMSGLAELYGEGRFQIIQNVGYPEQNYSHFRSTDIWMSASDSHELVNSGWTGRYLSDRFEGYPENFPNEDMKDPLAVEIGYGGSLLFQGPEAAMSMVISDPNFFYELINNEESEAPDTPAGDKLRYVRLIERQSQEYGTVVKEAAEKGANAAEYPETFIGEQLKIVSRLISGGLQTPVYMVRLGGFDTHDAQVEASDHTTGEHATLLKELNDAIMAFVKDTDSQGLSDRVLGMTFSEFGRRIVSNASLGTDHGSAAPMFFFGNQLVGGVTGNSPAISRDATYQDNLPYQFDFRQVYTSVLEQWFDTSSATTENSMLKSFEPIDIIGESRLLSAQELASGLSVFPNPVGERSTIDCSFANGHLSIKLYTYSGQKLATIYRGTAKQYVDWRPEGIPAGRYILMAQDDNLRKTFKVIKL